MNEKGEMGMKKWLLGSALTDDACNAYCMRWRRW